MKNRVVHFEIGSENPGKLSEFYKKALGWEINEWPGSDYWMVGKEEDRAVGAINGGIMKRFEKEGTINTIEVEDIEASIKDVIDAGGTIAKPLADMDFGDDQIMRWCYCKDPDGNVFSLMQVVPKK